ncbi:hypothetical protein [Calothrix sp. 336/3]|uniref:hypothetical protein n=1 Tax=Calothrix sp. 336/3 TaxID=1337936 RepID=UPI0004E36C4A|nr:hypothetical protein [Calothrix sp. 336/3]AKG23897.1 hypothetical protein IJ00_23635 [Calothrix sp. 336/3]
MKKLEIWKFGIQVFFSTIVIGLCAVQIVKENNQDNKMLYWSGMSSVLAYWLPSPASFQTENKTSEKEP